jgi:1-deoxy-D-xylulose-5-phosphate synthase
MAPKDFKELELMLEFAIDLKKPTMIRYPRGGEQKAFETAEEISLGKAEVLREGKDITIIAIGKMVARAMEVAEELVKSGIEATVINARFLKPLDEETIIRNLKNKNNVITIEDGTIVGGLGSKVEEVIFENKININLEKFAYPDEFIKHGSTNEIEEKYGLDVGSIVECLNSQEKNIKIVSTSC